MVNPGCAGVAAACLLTVEFRLRPAARPPHHTAGHHRRPPRQPDHRRRRRAAPVSNHNSSPAAPDPAVSIAELLTGSLAATAHLSAADRDEATALTQAMARLLLGAPLRSDGKLTVKTLAEEAGLKRNKLTHKHTGLKDLFYALVNSRHAERR